MKYLRVTMPDGSKWDVPANIIAVNRASHYFPDDAQSGDWQLEFDHSLNDPDAIKDWAENNMNWDKVFFQGAKLVSPPRLDPDTHQEGWVNGPKEIVEHD